MDNKYMINKIFFSFYMFSMTFSSQKLIERLVKTWLHWIESNPLCTLQQTFCV